MNISTDRRPAVLITGASRGLGAVMVQRLASEGYLVFAGFRAPSPAPVGGSIVPVPLDVTAPDSIAEAAERVADGLEGRGLFGLVNNAAVLHAGPLEVATAASVHAQVDTNVIGPIAVTQAFLPLLRVQPGRIVNVSSINAQLPLPFWAVFSATKAALVAISDAWRMELAPSGISVCVLTLGAFATDIRRRAVADWPVIDDPDRYRGAKASTAGLVDMLDATASAPGLVADALVSLMASDRPPAYHALGDGIDDLLALASQPAEAREAVITQLLAGAT